MIVLSLAAVIASTSPSAHWSRDALAREDIRLVTAGKKPLRFCIPQVDDGHPNCHNVCRTRTDWKRHGVDPLDYIGDRD